MAIAFTADAQKSKQADDSKVKFSVGADLGIPVGNLSPFASFAYGGDVEIDYMTTPTFCINVSAGYLGFSGKNGVTPKGLIPLLAGARYWFSPKVYGSAQFGGTLRPGANAQ